MGKIIELDRSIIPACDVSLEKFEDIVRATADIEKVGAYKIGPALTGRPGYDAVVEVARKYTKKPLIFDSQKWGTDIPDTAKPILTPLKESGIDAVILFPESGPATQYEWTKTAQDLGLGVLVGGLMTHPRFLQGDFSNKKDKNYTEIFKELGFEEDISGYLRETSPEQVYALAAKMGVTNFVVPGNKPDQIKIFKGIVETFGAKEPVFYAPGFVAQGGNLNEGAEAAGEKFHGIVGRAITKVENKYIKEAALELIKNL